MRKPTVNIDYTSRDYDGFKELLIHKLKEKMPEYTDTSETDAGIVILEALANGLDILSLYSDVIANDVVLPTTQSRDLAVILAQCLGYNPYNQTASVYPQVFVLSSAQETDTVIPKGTRVTTVASADLALLTYETSEDLIIPAGSLGNEKDTHGNYKYTVNVVSGETVSQDVLGSSRGTPLQTFVCNYTGVLVDSLVMYVDEGMGREIWRRVNSFLDCDENSKVYTASVDDFDNCTITFGNGIRGKIPVALSNNIITDYRVGGGEASNVEANQITVLATSIAGVDSTFNLKAITLGHNKESLESIKINAPASFRARDRLVTLGDYEDLLRINFYDFLALKVIRDGKDKRLAHIFYMMRYGREFTPKMVESVSAFISPRSMIGTTYDINEYTKQPVNIVGTLYVDSDYDKEKVLEEVKAFITQATFAYGEFVFGDTLIKSDLETEVKNTIKGVLSFRISSPSSDIIRPNQVQNVLTLGSLNITANYL